MLFFVIDVAFVVRVSNDVQRIQRLLLAKICLLLRLLAYIAVLFWVFQVLVVTNVGVFAIES